MISLHKRQQGFTVLELMVVLLVILGLGFLMFNSMSDVRARDRDTERRSDINLVHQQLEFFYDLGEASVYPTLENLQNDEWITANMKALAVEALQDPQGVRIGKEGSDYTYEPDGCTEGAGCTSYKLTAKLEKAAPYTKESVAQ